MTKRTRRLAFFAIVVLIMLWVVSGSRDKDVREPILPRKHGTAIIITGAAAKISQEAALLENLYSKGMLNDVVFISGASSGALNAAVLNAILSGKYTWQEYHETLSKLTNDDIFTRTGKRLPVDTEPLRRLIERVVTDRLGYKTLSDLPIPSAFSIVNLKLLPLKERTFRLSNRKINPESDTTLNVVDVLMASAAYPLAFPPVKIPNIKTLPDVPYHDGGIAADHVPYQSLLQFEKYSGFEVEKVYIISRKRDSISNTSKELEQFGIDKFKFFDKLGISPEAISNKGFFKRLKEYEAEAPSLAERTFIYVPEFKEEFLMFDFNTLNQQYETTTLWAKTHDPVLLRDYLKKFK